MKHGTFCAAWIIYKIKHSPRLKVEFKKKLLNAIYAPGVVALLILKCCLKYKYFNKKL